MKNLSGMFSSKWALMSIMLLVLSCMTGKAQTKVWNDIVLGYSNASVVKVKRVAIYGDRTELSLHIDYVKGEWISIAPNTVIKADGKEQMVKSATVLTLGERYTMTEDTLDFMLTFGPVPAKTETLDLLEPGGWCVMNIHDASLQPKGIIDTYWRDEATGDWLIGFAKDHAIYQNEVWDIAAMKEKKDAYVLTLMANGCPVGHKCAFLDKDIQDKVR